MIDRRQFVASCVASLSLGAELELRPYHVSRPWGIQLYTVRDQAKADLDGTLTALAAMGYSEVEFAGLYGHSALNVRRMLDDAGLSAPAGHVGLEALTGAALDQTVADAKTLGHRFLIVPWIPNEERTTDGYAATAEAFSQAAERLRAAGLAFGYHNHEFEFAPLGPDGPAATCGYDILLDRTDPALVCMELDLFWIRKGGRDAGAYFAKYPNRFRLVHIKDMAADGAMVDLGKGVMPWRELLDAAATAGVTHWFAEHDEPADAMEFARSAIIYLKTL
jgi:sugar phosphate isomerase/epimerase